MPGQSERINPAEMLMEAAHEAMAGFFDSQSLIDNLPISVFVFEVTKDERYRLALVNRVFERLFTVRREELIGNYLSEIKIVSTADYLRPQLDLAYRSKKEVAFEWQFSTPPNERHLTCQVIPVLNGSSDVRHMLGIITDRSAEKRAERHVLYNALHDSLTGLPNRVLFHDKIEQTTETQSFTEGQHSAVLVLNVDRFQLINESFGHVAGDEFLITLAAKLKACLRGKDTLARLNGDEFAIFLESIETIGDAVKVSDRIHQAIKKPYLLSGNEIHCSVSIGIASTISSLPHPEDLLRDADFAMHQAKTGGKARTEIYQRHTHQQARSLFQLETDLRRALTDEQLKLYYQPIINMKTGKLSGFEALARWPHPERGFVPPSEFIPLAEETGIIVPLGQWALMNACRDLQIWRRSHPEASNLSISVNVSGIQFTRSDVVKDISSVLQETGLPAGRLRIELTESTVMGNPEIAAQIQKRLKDLGVELALDDFGTGYSSLSYLQRFPLDYLKVDRAFVNHIDTNKENREIAEIIILLAKALDLKLVAEGIEEPAQRDVIKSLGCEYGQGFLFSKAVPFDEADEIVAADKDWLKI